MSSIGFLFGDLWLLEGALSVQKRKVHKNCVYAHLYTELHVLQLFLCV